MTPFERELHARDAIMPAAPARGRADSSGGEHVAEAQRIRILAATVHVSFQHGPQGATIARIVGSAGVSRRTFYELFEDRSDCLLAAFEEAVALATGRAGAAYRTHDRWVEGVRAGLFALPAFFDEQPKLARLCVVHSAMAGPGTLARRGELLDQLAGILDQGRGAARRQPPPLTAQGVVAGALGVIHSWLLEADPGALIELLNPLMGLLVLPYLGGGAARIELTWTVPAPPAARRRNGTPNPLEGLSMRLTYRTMSVLGTIAARPGSSNIQVSEGAGVIDQGQISRLLARLARLGLIQNTGVGQAEGAANAWQLTPQGEHVERAMSRETLGATR
jgi:AcrR family transcriptional regulator